MPAPNTTERGATPSTLTSILDQLEGVVPSGDGWSARCPAHADTHNSLSVSEGEDGRALLYCHTGCEVDEIVESLGLGVNDLFPSSGRGDRSGSRRSAILQQAPTDGLRLSEYAEAKGLPEPFLHKLGLSELSYLGQTAIRIPYLDAGGEERAIRFRLALEGPDRFRWKNGSKPFLYGLWRLEEARRVGYVWLVEGESDCHTLWQHGIPAIGLPGANGWREDRDAEHLDGIETIYVVIEPDQGGESVLKWIARSSVRDRVRLVTLGEHKDVCELRESAGAFRRTLREAREAAVSWDDREQAERQAVALAALDECGDLARDPAILDRLLDELAQGGLVGEERAAKLLYLALTSRLLDRPVSVVVKGPSSGGKSYTAEQVLRLFPENAYYVLTAASERALAYSQEPLKHRFLVMYEAAGMESEFTSYLIRSLLSEGRIRYETVEKTSEGIQPRLIEREGPTGLLVTTTRVSLHPENETRLISLPVTDTPEQTSRILLALASSESKIGPDLEQWQALQTWLTGAEHRVEIPYAMSLAEMIPPVATRLRRDFGAILTLIRTHAILHQENRKRTADGAIIATPDDYKVVRELVADLVGDVVGASVPETVRETVAAVGRLLEHTRGTTGYGMYEEGVSLTAVAKELGGLDKSTASRRVRQALKDDYLRNLESRRGKPFKLVLGNALPEEQQILPSVEELCPDSCTVAPTEGTSTTPPPEQDAPPLAA